MGVSRFNSEGYYDPTPHEALSNMKKEARPWKPLVYVASPFAGDVERNVMNARRYCRFAVENGAIPLAPHLLLPQFMSEKTEREKAMFMNLVFLGKCEQLWVFGERPGRDAESGSHTHAGTAPYRCIANHRRSRWF